MNVRDAAQLVSTIASLIAAALDIGLLALLYRWYCKK